MLSAKQDSTRKKRAILYYVCNLVLLGSLFLFVMYSIRSLLLPILFGALLAYLCKPVIQSMRVSGWKSLIKVSLVTIAFVSMAITLVYQVKQSIPTEQEELELKVRLQYKINNIYNKLIVNQEGMIHNWVQKETRGGIAGVNSLLMLNENEQKQFEALYNNSDSKVVNFRMKQYYNHVRNNYYSQPRVLASKGDSSFFKDMGFNLGDLYSSFSIWLLMPIVFVFLLFDRGKIRTYLMSYVPNRYFELSLTIAYKVDKAIGKYLRGTFVQCSLVGTTLFVCFVLIGFPWKPALLISLFAGIANAIPFLGPFIGLIVGLIYALILEDLNPIIPIFNESNIFYGVFASVLIAQLLDNVYFQPFVLGNAVNLHPLIVVLGVMAGASFMGWVGMLLAVPSIVIVKVVVETLTHQLKAYKII